MHKSIKFIGEGFNSVNNIFPKEESNKNYFVRLSYENPRINPAPSNNNGQVITPDIAFKNGITYNVSIVCDAVKLEKVFLARVDGQETVEKRVTIVESRADDNQIVLFKIPVMVRSAWCASMIQGIHTNLDPADPGCFFICNGQPKTISPLERSPNNKIVTYYNQKKGTVNAVVNSVSQVSEFTNKNILQIVYGQRVRFQGVKDDKDVTSQFLYVETSQFDNQAQVVSAEKDKVRHTEREDGEEEPVQEEEEKVQIDDSKDKPSVFLMLAALGVSEDCQILQLCSFGNSSIHTTFINNFATSEAQNESISLDAIRTTVLDLVRNKNNVTQELENSIITGKWTVNMLGISKQLPNSSIPARTAALKMVSNAPIFKKQSHGPLETRHINNNQIGFYCPVGSPDGGQCGIIKEMSLSCDITIDFSTTRDSVQQYISLSKDVFSYSRELSLEREENGRMIFPTKIFIYGKMLFLTLNPLRVLEYFKEGRFNSKIPRNVTYEIQGDWNEILIYGDSGRMIRPLFSLEQVEIRKNISLQEQSKQPEKQKQQEKPEQSKQTYKVIEKITQITDHDKLYNSLIKQNTIKTWEQLIQEFPKSFEWSDIQEISNRMVSPSAQTLEYHNFLRSDIIKSGMARKISCTDQNRFNTSYQIFDLMEIHPINVLGINPSTVPYPHCNYAPRNIFAFVQMKRGVQKPYTDNDMRSDINQFLVLGSAPLVQTMTTNMIDSNRSFNGTNICVAVLMDNGFQQEDSITISSRLAGTSYLQCKQDIIEDIVTRQQAGTTEVIGPPRGSGIDQKLIDEGTYDKLDNKGLIREGSIVKRGDVIICKTLRTNNALNQDRVIDKSLRFEYDEGVIVKVKQLSIDGQQKTIIRFLVPLYPQVGDKYAARCGQKGTIGTIRDENLMPYTSDGTPIDIIVNPCSFATRMTIGMNIEHYTSYLCLATGLFLDASMFCDVKAQIEQTYSSLLKRYSREKNQENQQENLKGNLKENLNSNNPQEITQLSLISPRKQPEDSPFIKMSEKETYERILGRKKIFSAMTGDFVGYSQVGFVFYSAQEQKASSKLYAVGFGEAARNQAHQPREGGKNHGGSRLGEMEAAALLSAGASNIIKVFAQQHSDGFIAKICKQCGLYASRDQNQKKWFCSNCKGTSSIASTSIQYSSKYLKDIVNSVGMTLNFMPNDFADS